MFDTWLNRSGRAVISFGNRALRSLFTVLAMNTHQVAMANKRYFNGTVRFFSCIIKSHDFNATFASPPSIYDLITASNVQCVIRKQCKGMQTHLDAFNRCADPACSKV
jgi:hypothetical protein